MTNLSKKEYLKKRGKNSFNPYEEEEAQHVIFSHVLLKEM
jgi:hypothetical protein